MYTLEKRMHVPYIYTTYNIASNNTPSYTHVSPYVV